MPVCARPAEKVRSRTATACNMPNSFPVRGNHTALLTLAPAPGCVILAE